MCTVGDSIFPYLRLSRRHRCANKNRVRRLCERAERGVTNGNLSRERQGCVILGEGLRRGAGAVRVCIRASGYENINQPPGAYANCEGIAASPPSDGRSFALRTRERSSNYARAFHRSSHEFLTKEKGQSSFEKEWGGGGMGPRKMSPAV